MENVKTKNLFVKLFTSPKGQATYVLIFVLIPFILLVPLIAIDINTYLLSKSQLQNALDASAIVALTKSTDDAYRSDKVLKIITTDGQTNNFVNSFYGEIHKNFRPIDKVTTPEKIGAGKYITMFTPGFSFSKDSATVLIEYTGTGQGSAYTSGSLGQSHGIDGGVTVTLDTDIILPTMSKFLQFFGDENVFDVHVTVKSGVTGIRILTPDQQLDSKNEWGY